MELLALLLLIIPVIVFLVLPIWTIVNVRSTRERNAKLTQRLDRLEDELLKLKRARPAATAPTASAPAKVAPTSAPATPAQPAPASPIPSHAAPPPKDVEDLTLVPFYATPRAAAVPPQLPPVVPSAPPSTSPPAPRKPAINWEQFMGVKLFLWIGGLALFLGVAFFVKYSFDNDIIPREVRVALGFLAGAALVAGGVKLGRQRYAAQGQTLCATGIVILYAVTFACRAHYHFAFFGVLPTFALMVLITATGFLLAVRLEAQVVALLGMLGGFLTPVLLSTGVDNPGGLFGYIALLDVGLIAVARHRRWHYLFPLGAAGTVLMEIGWADKFFAPEKFLSASIVLLGFSVLFLLGLVGLRRKQPAALPLVATAALLPLVALGFGFYFIGLPALAARPGAVFAFVLLADFAVLALAWIEAPAVKAQAVAGALVFVLLALWTGNSLTTELLPWALGLYLAFAALHTAGPLVLARRHPGSAPDGWNQLWPAITLLLLLLSISRLPIVPLLVWPAVLLLDVIAIGLALLTASLTGLVAVLILTLIATGLWVFKIPAELTALPSLLLVVGGFAVLFFGAGLWVVRRLGDRLDAAAGTAPGWLPVPVNVRAITPSLAALLPFALLVMVVTRLPLADPSPVFGLALLLVGLTFGLSRTLVSGWLPAAALVGVLALEYTWHERLFQPAHGVLALVWYLGFYAGFTAFPFVFRKTFTDERGPWITAALSGPLQFALIHRLVAATWPNNLMGLLPAAFALPALGSLVALLRTLPAAHPQRLERLAWFGGVALFFVTLVFPLQFNRQWITLGWALEGVALLWLFHRVPHPGLRLTGAGLLIAAFTRLALNPAVLGYHSPGSAPIFNWYLYAYGLTTFALFAGARLLAPPRDCVLGSSAPPLLNGLGVVLAFLLLNLEIADYFSPATGTLTFEFSGNLARDMTYTIAWALFAFGLLVVGIWRRQRAARYAALGLLSVALLKLFLHDLASLGSLYRIGALLAVAVIAILASFAYQRFLPSASVPASADDTANPSPPPPAP